MSDAKPLYSDNDMNQIAERAGELVQREYPKVDYLRHIVARCVVRACIEVMQEKRDKSGAIILALLVGLAVFGVGTAALTGRHRAIVAQPNGIGCDYSKLRATTEAAQANPGKVAAIVAASVAASIAADRIEIQIGDRTIIQGK